MITFIVLKVHYFHLDHEPEMKGLQDMIEQKKSVLHDGLLQEGVLVDHLSEEDRGHLLGVVGLPVEGADLFTGGN